MNKKNMILFSILAGMFVSWNPMEGFANEPDTLNANLVDVGVDNNAQEITNFRIRRGFDRFKNYTKETAGRAWNYTRDAAERGWNRTKDTTRKLGEFANNKFEDAKNAANTFSHDVKEMANKSKTKSKIRKDLKNTLADFDADKYGVRKSSVLNEMADMKLSGANNISIHKILDNDTSMGRNQYDIRRDVVSAIKSEANINAVNEKGETVIQRAIDLGDPNIVGFLLDLGVDVSIPTSTNENIFVYALEKGDINIIRLFVDKGIELGDANLNVRLENGETPLRLAIKLKDVLIVNYLFNNGANLEGYSDDEHPLVLAFEEDYQNFNVIMSIMRYNFENPGSNKGNTMRIFKNIDEALDKTNIKDMALYGMVATDYNRMKRRIEENPGELDSAE